MYLQNTPHTMLIQMSGWQAVYSATLLARMLEAWYAHYYPLNVEMHLVINSNSTTTTTLHPYRFGPRLSDRYLCNSIPFLPISDPN